MKLRFSYYNTAEHSRSYTAINHTTLHYSYAIHHTITPNYLSHTSIYYSLSEVDDMNKSLMNLCWICCNSEESKLIRGSVGFEYTCSSGCIHFDYCCNKHYISRVNHFTNSSHRHGILNFNLNIIICTYVGVHICMYVSIPLHKPSQLASNAKSTSQSKQPVSQLVS